MYDGFSDKGAHSTDWVRIAKDFLNLAFTGGRHVAKCPCKKCGNYRLLSQDDIQVHLAKEEFMPNYLVQPAVGAESDGNKDVYRMDDMIVDIAREYDQASGEQPPPPEVQNFYRLLAASGKKVHDGTDVTVLQVVTCLMVMKSKYNFSNQCYNDIVK